MNLQDSLFSEQVESDIVLFVDNAARKRVLVFPPVNNYRRFLIHQFVQEQFPDLLYTFSIGQGPCRRTVVCYKTDVIRDPKLNGGSSRACGFTKLSDSACAMGVEGMRSLSASPENARQRQVKSVPTVGIYRPPAARKSRSETLTDRQPEQLATDAPQPAKTSRQRRPDRAVYVPRARRGTEAESSPSPQEANRPPRSTRDRTSTASPAHTSSKLSTETSRQGSNFYHTVLNTDNRAKRLETPYSDGGSEPNLCCAYDFKGRRNSQEANVLAENTLRSSSSSGLARSVDRSSLQSFKRYSEENAVLRRDSSGLSTDRKVENREYISKRRDSAPLENGVDKGLTEQVQTKLTEELGRHESGLVLVSKEVWPSRPEPGIQPACVSEVDSDVNIIEKGRLKSEPLDQESNGHNIDLIMSQHANTKDHKAEEEILNREEVVNLKNRRIIRQNVISDVLIISDNEPKHEGAKNEMPVVSVTLPAKSAEKKVKKVERPKSKPAAPPSPPLKVNRDECDWESLFDDNGDCLDPTLIEELTTAVGEVTIEQPKGDYKTYTRAPIEVGNDEFAHVVEIYNFPSDYKTSDLAAVFSPFKNGGFELKWVDDTHCLGVFSSPLIAAEVLGSDHPFVKTRPLCEGTALSKTKARRSAEYMQPYRARPETCAALARRLVTGALGVRLATARQEREHEKIVLREAKEKRRLANKQRDDAWEGVIADK